MNNMKGIKMRAFTAFIVYCLSSNFKQSYRKIIAWRSFNIILLLVHNRKCNFQEKYYLRFDVGTAFVDAAKWFGESHFDSIL